MRSECPVYRRRAWSILLALTTQWAKQFCLQRSIDFGALLAPGRNIHAQERGHRQTSKTVFTGHPHSKISTSIMQHTSKSTTHDPHPICVSLSQTTSSHGLDVYLHIHTSIPASYLNIHGANHTSSYINRGIKLKETIPTIIHGPVRLRQTSSIRTLQGRRSKKWYSKLRHLTFDESLRTRSWRCVFLFKTKGYRFVSKGHLMVKARGNGQKPIFKSSTTIRNAQKRPDRIDSQLLRRLRFNHLQQLSLPNI